MRKDVHFVDPVSGQREKLNDLLSSYLGPESLPSSAALEPS